MSEQEKPPECVYLVRFLDNDKPQFGSFEHKQTSNNLTHDPESGVPLRQWDSVEYVRAVSAPARVSELEAMLRLFAESEHGRAHSFPNQPYRTFEQCELRGCAAARELLDPKGTKG